MLAPVSVLPRIPDESSALRRINPDWYVDDGKGGRRISSMAFQLKAGGISVGLECILFAMRLPLDVMVASYPSYGLAALGIRMVREDLGLEVRHDPTDAEPWHGGIHGRITGACRNKLAMAATTGLTIEPQR